MNILKQDQEKWAQEKYAIMAHSQKHYQQIRELFRNNEWTEHKHQKFIQLLADAYTYEPSIGSLTNAYQHIWGYFKNKADTSEKKQFLCYLSDLPQSNYLIKHQLINLTLKYEIVYLMQSTLLFPKS
ncbi:YbgA family protein [Vagococcus vulneris]|uniref:DUF1722 domain-containing protein n=1 Tax=Vagococcus vulneris TaxID=1977869 RepID=A0A429ZX22_9ENTE|nr:YbgA family protein [Vagococcus vulneris]RST98396.1 hypothetical protein CBF37_07740 [Vagococcus vulneris]